jgi:Zn-dependent peptidase ImmA (M78 family)/DNA-binding XRE family transcriptional regulator
MAIDPITLERQRAARITLGKRLKSARVNCGLTQEAVAEAIGIARTAVLNIEAGTRSLSSTELSQFAELYQRPSDYFLQATDAVEPADLILARQLPGYQDNPIVKESVEWCSELCRIGIELERLLGRRPRTIAPTYDLPTPQRTEDAIEQGIWASGMRLPNEMSGLFLRHASIRSVILVNCDHSRARKRFSYAHEYAHAILDRNMSGLVSTNNNSHELIEKRANAFAATFLMPQAGVHWFLGLLDKGGASRRHLHVYDVAREEEVDGERRAAPRSQRITFKDASMLAHHFGTSYESAVYRLRDLGVIKSAERQVLLGDQQAKAAEEFGGLFYTNLPAGPDKDLTRDIAILAIEAFRREEVPPSYFEELGVKLKIPGDRLLKLAQTAAYD